MGVGRRFMRIYGGGRGYCFVVDGGKIKMGGKKFGVEGGKIEVRVLVINGGMRNEGNFYLKVEWESEMEGKWKIGVKVLFYSLFNGKKVKRLNLMVKCTGNY